MNKVNLQLNTLCKTLVENSKNNNKTVFYTNSDWIKEFHEQSKENNNIEYKQVWIP